MTLVLFFAVLGVSVAQQDKSIEKRRAKIQQKLIQKLELTDKEQAEFLPLVWEYADAKRTHHERMRSHLPSKEKMGSLSDAEVEQLIQARFDSKEQMLQLQRTYHEKFKRVLPIKKVAKFHIIEKRIKDTMKKKIKKRLKNRERKQR